MSSPVCHPKKKNNLLFLVTCESFTLYSLSYFFKKCQSSDVYDKPNKPAPPPTHYTPTQSLFISLIGAFDFVFS